MTVTNVPTHLKHKPVVIIDNYGDVDGRWACDTDARGISLGLAVHTVLFRKAVF